MKCPYCVEKMESGELKSKNGARLHWQPDNKNIFKVHYTKSGVEDSGGIILGYTYNTSQRILAYSCKQFKY